MERISITTQNETVEQLKNNAARHAIIAKAANEKRNAKIIARKKRLDKVAEKSWLQQQVDHLGIEQDLD